MTDPHDCRPLPSFVRAYGREPIADDVYLCKPCGAAWVVTADARGLKTFIRAKDST